MCRAQVLLCRTRPRWLVVVMLACYGVAHANTAGTTISDAPRATALRHDPTAGVMAMMGLGYELQEAKDLAGWTSFWQVLRDEQLPEAVQLQSSQCHPTTL